VSHAKRWRKWTGKGSGESGDHMTEAKTVEERPRAGEAGGYRFLSDIA
jgi:hypothetical protein